MQGERAIDGEEIASPRGTRDMPTYGDLFREVRRDEAFVKQRVALLTGYIEAIQKKRATASSPGPAC